MDWSANRSESTSESRNRKFSGSLWCGVAVINKSRSARSERISPMRYRMGEILSERAERLLLMTATPHQSDPENFRFLLSLVDSDLFADQSILQRAVERQENPIFLRRLKEDMRHFDGK